MFDPRPLCCSSLTTAVGGTTDTNFVDSAHPTVARISTLHHFCLFLASEDTGYFVWGGGGGGGGVVIVFCFV